MPPLASSPAYTSQIRRLELLSRAYPRVAQEHPTLHVLASITAKWNAVQTWVTNEVVCTPKLKERAQLLEKFILLAEVRGFGVSFVDLC